MEEEWYFDISLSGRRVCESVFARNMREGSNPISSVAGHSDGGALYYPTNLLQIEEQ